MNDARAPIDAAKTEFLQAKATISRSLEKTAEDRLAWSPAPSARTPLEIYAHAANSIRNIHDTLRGIVFPFPTSAEGDRSFREWERSFTTREAAVQVMETNSADYILWLDALDPARLDDEPEFPYGMGRFPIRLGITFVPRHTFWHAAQIDYVQTVYGDRDWHTGF